MARQQTTKRCHWVPKAYLKKFAVDPVKPTKIWRFSKEKRDPKLKPIDNVAVRFYLYAPKSPDGRRDDFLEKKLARLENFFGTSLWDDVCTGFVDLDFLPLRKMISLLIATTFLRNPTQFEQAKDLHRQLIEHFSREKILPRFVSFRGVIRPLETDGWEAYRDADENEIQKMWGEQINNAGWLARILLKMRWSVIFSEEPAFITSDNPTMIVHPSLSFRGIRNAESMIFFPISPTRILVLDNRQSEPQSKYYPLKDGPGSLNGLIWRNAIEHMFTPRHPDIVCNEMNADAEQMGFGAS